MKELRKLGRSFSYAAKGIGWAVRTQRNMRIHLTALVLVVVFGFVEGLRPTHWCLELLCCMAVISLELMNSALESACDAITREKNPLIGRAKDAAAGAVLVAAFGSVVVALVILLGSGYWETVREHVKAGEKIAIVSNKPQTTRNRISAVVNRDDTQIVFMDTPGYHKARNKLGDYMDNVVKESITDVDAILLLVEPIASVGTQESILIESMKDAKIPVILVINKIDTLENKEQLFPVIAAYSQAMDFAAIVPISARNREGIDELFDEVKKYAAPGPQLFPDGMVTDQPEKQVMAEIIREKLLWCLDREVPHGTAVEIEKFSEREDSGIIDIEAVIYCEKASHKGIIIGKNGAMLKKISTMARNDCEKFMGTKVYLRCWVKVKENWRDSDFMLKNFGYRDQ